MNTTNQVLDTFEYKYELKNINIERIVFKTKKNIIQ
jgi:hypothetical protein